MDICFTQQQIDQALGLLPHTWQHSDSPLEIAQPIHTYYLAANQFCENSVQQIARQAQTLMAQYAAEASDFIQVFNHASEASLLYEAVKARLRACPIQDLRLDFEDGLGHPSDKEEDQIAVKAAKETAQALVKGSLPPFFGIRVKPFERQAPRSIRTLGLYLNTLLQNPGGRLPVQFVVTLPKVTRVEQIQSLLGLLEVIERRYGLTEQSLKIEIMVEDCQAVFNEQGVNPIAALVQAAKGRCRGVHIGIYDYQTSCDLLFSHQHLRSSSCDFMRHMLKNTLASSHLWLSDGGSNSYPIAPHCAIGNQPLSTQQQLENKQAIHQAWRKQFDEIIHALKMGFYQGWDLHPGHLPMRFAACFVFYNQDYAINSQQLNLMLSGAQVQDMHQGDGLLHYFKKAFAAGALTQQQLECAGLSELDLSYRSFHGLLTARKLKSD